MNDETERLVQRWIIALCKAPIPIGVELMPAVFAVVEAGPATLKRHKVAASLENPEYLVESGKTGLRAAQRPSALRRAWAGQRRGWTCV